MQNGTLVVNFDGLGMTDVGYVGGKNASLGEMISNLSEMGVRVPGGFATTADAFREFLSQDGLDKKINKVLDELDIEDVNALQEAGKTIRTWVELTRFPSELKRQIIDAYNEMSGAGAAQVAVRSSATAEDLPEASFAGQQETYLNVSGVDDVLVCIKKVFASLYNDRAISYRVHQGFNHAEVALSAGIQKMARSDIGTSGVLFTLDTESGFDGVVFITAAYGLGETVVQGAVNPDEFYVAKELLAVNKPAVISRNLGSKKIKMIYADKNSVDFVQTVKVEPEQANKFSLNDEQIEELARFAVIIEKHYQRPMDIEWALDGADNKLYILQARPETVKSHDVGSHKIKRYYLNEKSKVLVTGRAIGQKIGAGSARIITDPAQMSTVQQGDVLVTDMTDPDWEPVMKRAAAIITNRGGRTCHAAIIARELGVPAIVGCGDATSRIAQSDMVTASCAEGDEGLVYSGNLDYCIEETDTGNLPELPTKIMMNVGNPSRAFSFAAIPNEGVGLARLEFVINNMIGIHPHALLEFDEQDASLKDQINGRISGYASPTDFYIQKIAESIAILGVAFADKPVIVRMSDFKSNEYSNLIGGSKYEPNEENPMIGFRGTSRYLSDSFRECFKMECEAIKIVRDKMGLGNIQIMIPFVRTLEEARHVIDLLAEYGLERGKNGLKIIMMCEVPSNAVLAKKFLRHFDGFSIGSNDMTQLSLGLDRDSGLIAKLFDERDPAVKKLIKMAIKACRKQNKYIGICGQGPSDYPDFARWLLEQKISSISLNPDTVIDTWKTIGS